MHAIPAPERIDACWLEPWFFKLRTISKLGWIVRISGFVTLSVLSFVPMWLEKDPNQLPLGRASIIVLPPLVAAGYMALIELPNFRRNIVITNTDIACIGVLMPLGQITQLFLGLSQWNKREVKQIQLLRSGAASNPFSFGLMIITPKYSKPRQVAVPLRISLDKVATVLHLLNYSVQLSDWDPGMKMETENGMVTESITTVDFMELFRRLFTH